MTPLEQQLRQELQQCQHRARMALETLDSFQVRFIAVAASLSIVDFAELVGRIKSIRTLLAGGEGHGNCSTLVE